MNDNESDVNCYGPSIYLCFTFLLSSSPPSDLKRRRFRQENPDKVCLRSPPSTGWLAGWLVK